MGGLTGWTPTEHDVLVTQISEADALTYPVLALEYAYRLGRRWEPGETLIASDPSTAFRYVASFIQERWPPCEEAMAKDVVRAHRYASTFLKRRWPECEPYLIIDPQAATHYANDVLKGRWLDAEKYIITDPWWAIQYSYHVMKKRWPEAEQDIAAHCQSQLYLDVYPDAKSDWAANGWLDWLDT